MIRCDGWAWWVYALSLPIVKSTTVSFIMVCSGGSSIFSLWTHFLFSIISWSHVSPLLHTKRGPVLALCANCFDEALVLSNLYYFCVKRLSASLQPGIIKFLERLREGFKKTRLFIHILWIRGGWGSADVDKREGGGRSANVDIFYFIL